jgi:hypothetical protein
VVESLRSRAAGLGVATREQFSWVLYDWANSAFATTVIAAVFPVYYQTIAADALVSPSGLERTVVAAGVTSPSVAFGYTTAISLALVALASPVLGALADHYRLKRRFLAWARTADGRGLFYEASGRDAASVREEVETGLRAGMDLREWRFVEEGSEVVAADAGDGHTTALVLAVYGRSSPLL